MNQLHEILNLAKQNKGVLTTAMVVKAGFSRGSLKYLVDNGRLELYFHKRLMDDVPRGIA